MFSRVFRVVATAVDGPDALVQVMPEDERVTPGPILVVDGDESRKLVVRGARGIYDANKTRLPGSLLIVDLPEYDLESLVGERLVPSG